MVNLGLNEITVFSFILFSINLHIGLPHLSINVWNLASIYLSIYLSIYRNMPPFIYSFIISFKYLSVLLYKLWTKRPTGEPSHEQNDLTSWVRIMNRHTPNPKDKTTQGKTTHGHNVPDSKHPYRYGGEKVLRGMVCIIITKSLHVSLYARLKRPLESTPPLPNHVGTLRLGT